MSLERKSAKEDRKEEAICIPNQEHWDICSNNILYDYCRGIKDERQKNKKGNEEETEKIVEHVNQIVVVCAAIFRPN